MKECYVKCASNEQAQQLRPYLVEVGFVDDKEWNDGCLHYVSNCSYMLIHKIDAIEIANHDNYYPLLYAVSADADLAETAKVIKELFDKL